MSYTRKTWDTTSVYDVSSMNNIEDGIEEALEYADGAVPNLCEQPYNGTTTTDGITFTVNSDLSITVDGTATDNCYFWMRKYDQTIGEGTYTISGSPEGGATSTYMLGLAERDTDSTTTNNTYTEVGEGQSFTIDGDRDISFYIRIYAGTTVSNKTFYPMLEKSSTPHDYVQYAGPGDTIVEILQNLYSLLS